MGQRRRAKARGFVGNAALHAKAPESSLRDLTVMRYACPLAGGCRRVEALDKPQSLATKQDNHLMAGESAGESRGRRRGGGAARGAGGGAGGGAAAAARFFTQTNTHTHTHTHTHTPATSGR